jgi:hypothetical protein
MLVFPVFSTVSAEPSFTKWDEMSSFLSALLITIDELIESLFTLHLTIRMQQSNAQNTNCRFIFQFQLIIADWVHKTFFLLRQIAGFSKRKYVLRKIKLKTKQKLVSRQLYETEREAIFISWSLVRQIFLYRWIEHDLVKLLTWNSVLAGAVVEQKAVGRQRNLGLICGIAVDLPL